MTMTPATFRYNFQKVVTGANGDKIEVIDFKIGTDNVLNPSFQSIRNHIADTYGNAVQFLHESIRGDGFTLIFRYPCH